MNYLKRLIFSLSLANIYFIRVWNEVLCTDIIQFYAFKNIPNNIQILSVILSVTLCATIIFIASYLVNNIRNNVIINIFKLILLASAIIPLIGIGRIIGKIDSKTISFITKLINNPNNYITYTLSIIILIALIFIIIKKVDFFYSGYKKIILTLSPFILITFINSSFLMYTNTPNDIFKDKSPVDYHPTSRSNQRFIWLIFDELDQRLVFERPPSWLNLQNLNELKKTSIYCSHANPPSGFTEISIPALTTGIMFSKSMPIAPNELSLARASDGEMVKWSECPNIFQEVTSNNLNTVLIGWYHPYGRILGDSLTTCLWYEDRVQSNSNGCTILEYIVNQTRSLFETPRFSLFGHSLTSTNAIHQYKSILKDILQYSGNETYSLVFAHIPLPHSPRIYDHQKKEIISSNDFSLGYFDNVELVDITIGKIIKCIKDAGLWDNTALLITGDHSWRHSYDYDNKYDKRVPYILKMPRQDHQIIYNNEFNTIVTKDIVKKVVLNNEENIDMILKKLN